MIKMLLSRIVFYLFDYISYFPYTFVVIEVFTISLMIIVGTGLEKMFFQVIVFMPLGLWGSNSFGLGVSDVVKIMGFWSLVVMMVDKVLYKIFRVKFDSKFFLIMFSGLHLLSIVRLREIAGMWQMIVMFYLISLLSFFMFRGLSKIKGIFFRIISG